MLTCLSHQLDSDYVLPFTINMVHKLLISNWFFNLHWTIYTETANSHINDFTKCLVNRHLINVFLLFFFNLTHYYLIHLKNSSDKIILGIIFREFFIFCVKKNHIKLFKRRVYTFKQTKLTSIYFPIKRSCLHMCNWEQGIT